jgi:hypothetical protein
MRGFLSPDLTRVRFDQATGDRQTQAGASGSVQAALGTVSRWFAAIKAVEDPLAIVHRDARTAVHDAKFDVGTCQARVDHDLATRWRVPERVIEKVTQYARQAHAISGDLRQRWWHATR